MNPLVTLDPKAVHQAIFLASTETDAIIAVYRMVYPNWDDIEKIGDDVLSWPACNEDTWKQIARWFQDLTERLNQGRERDKQVMPGGNWLQNGFTVHRHQEMEDLEEMDDWMILRAAYTLSPSAASRTEESPTNAGATTKG